MRIKLLFKAFIVVQALNYYPRELFIQLRKIFGSSLSIFQEYPVNASLKNESNFENLAKVKTLIVTQPHYYYLLALAKHISRHLPLNQKIDYRQIAS